MRPIFQEKKGIKGHGRLTPVEILKTSGKKGKGTRSVSLEPEEENLMLTEGPEK